MKIILTKEKEAQDFWISEDIQQAGEGWTRCHC